MADFQKAYKKTAKNEGGYANVPGDTGGETYAGISRKWWPNWAGWKIIDARKPLKHNQTLNIEALHALVQAFYKKQFWDTIGGDAIDDQLTAERLYDFGVNAGASRSLKQIQEALGIPQTGKPDAATIAAINNPLKHLS